jgi:UDP-N-acetyl-D-glucosamine dehydrogenase
MIKQTQDNPGTGVDALPQPARTLLERVADGSARVGIVGLGYVGLPLAVAFARAGYRVTGLDISPGTVAGINRGESHIGDVDATVLAALVGEGLISATTDPAALAACDALAICVPTPLGKTRDPDVSYILAALTAFVPHARPGQLLVLESTTYPGTTRELVMPALEARGLRVGADVFVCFSPERVDPANPRWKVENTPKVIGGSDAVSLALGAALYARAVERVVPVSSTEAAELTKLLENTFRSINIALANEMAQVCDRLGVDVWEVIEAAATKPFGFMKFTPGPGIGGHCIPLDPHYLAWKMRTLDYRTRMIELAGEINGEMPRFVVRKVQNALNRARLPLNGSRVLILGVAYKKDVNDLRESPALEIIRLLQDAGADVVYHDPFCPAIEDDGHTPLRGLPLRSLPLDAAELERADCVLIVTDHTGVDYGAVVRGARLVVDTRNATAGLGDARVVPLAGPPQPVLAIGTHDAGVVEVTV